MLIEKFQNLENIYRQSATIEKKSLQEKIAANKEIAFLSRQLVTLDDNVNLDIKLENLTLKKWDQHQVEILLKDMEFTRLLTRAAQAQQLLTGGDIRPLQAKSTAKVNYQKINNEQDLAKLIDRWKKVDEFVSTSKPIRWIHLKPVWPVLPSVLRRRSVLYCVESS